VQPHIYTLAPKPASLEEPIQKAKTLVVAAKAHQAAGYSDSPATTTILSSARRSRVSAARSALRSTEKARSSRQTPGGSSPRGARTFWVFGTQHSSWSDLRADLAAQSLPPINICDLKFSSDGVVANVRKSKTDLLSI
jgi:hypothetical protein